MKRPSFFTWVEVSGWFLLGGVVLFLGGYFYERTYLPWKLGPSSFSYAGALLNLPVFLSGVVFVVLGHLWFVVELGLVLWKKHHLGKLRWLAVIMMGVTVSLFYLPSRVWEMVAIQVLGSGRHGAEYLMRAAGEGDERLVQVLLNRGAEVNGRNSNGVTALHVAASAGRESMVRFLLAHHADIHARRDYCGGTPLMEAAYMGHVGVVKVLLAGGADHHQKDCHGQKATDLASDKQVEAALRLFVAEGNR